MATLLDEIGGRTAVEHVVADFYGRVLCDSRLGPYFRGISMTRLQRHQTDFLCAALGGRDLYRGRDMAVAHSGMRITNDDFDRMIAHLGDSMISAGVSARVIDQVVAILSPLRAHIVGSEVLRAVR
jgi:hemoglobin